MKFRVQHIIILLSIFIYACKKDVSKTENDNLTLAQLIPENTTIDILIDKSDYELTVLVADTVVKKYPVVFGGNPIDDKQKEGDKRTPEGNFNVRDKYPHKKWSKFIWIDYPNKDSWKKFNKLKAEGIIKDGETIGGEVGIHGVPDGMDHIVTQKQNWTLGCISMKNKDVNELYSYISKKSKIRIKK